MKIHSLNVLKGVSQYERRINAKEREYAFVKFDLRTGERREIPFFRLPRSNELRKSFKN